LKKTRASESLRGLLKQIKEQLKAAGIDNPVSSAELIIAEALGIQRPQIYLQPERKPSPSQLRKIRNWARERARRKPFEYIVGKAWFREIELLVTPEVLVPRPETELLVEQALKLIRADAQIQKILDLGTGSGAIILSLAHELKKYPRQIQFFASDLSKPALKLAMKNASRLGLKSKINFQPGHLFQPFPRRKFNLIICNPPYIPTNELPKLMPEVAKYEPRIALDGRKDGIHLIRQLLAQAPAYLVPAGYLLLEIGKGQAAKVKNLSSPHLHLQKLAKDYSNIDRIALFQLRLCGLADSKQKS